MSAMASVPELQPLAPVVCFGTQEPVRLVSVLSRKRGRPDFYEVGPPRDTLVWPRLPSEEALTAFGSKEGARKKFGQQ